MDTKPITTSATHAAHDASDTAASAVHHVKHTSEAFLGAIADHADEAQRKVAAGAKTIERDVKHAANEVKHTAGEVKTEATQAADEVKSAAAGIASRAGKSVRATYSDIVDVGADLPARTSRAVDAIEAHVRANPRTDLAIAAGASVLLGALLGKRVVHLAVIAGAAYAATKAYPQISRLASSRTRVSA